MAALVSPHGGRDLRPRQVAAEELAEERRRAQSLPKLRISSREKGDLVMLGIGGFTPLAGFMGRDDWRRVCDEMRMADGLFWPIPITLSTDDASVKIGAEIALVDPEDGAPLATMKVNEKYTIDKAHECKSVFRTTDEAHPGVKMVMQEGEVNLAGPVRVLSDGGFKSKYGALFMTPAETRAEFARLGWSRVAAFQTRNPMHRSHEYLAKVAIEVCDGVLVHSLLGNVKPGDIPAEVRTKAIAALSARHALRRAARGAPARALSPELRLLASHRRARSCRRRKLLRPVRRAPHLRRDSAGRTRDPAAQDGRDLLVPPLLRHGFGPHLPAR